MSQSYLPKCLFDELFPLPPEVSESAGDKDAYFSLPSSPPASVWLPRCHSASETHSDPQLEQ